MNVEPIHTERLTLRLYEPADADRVLVYYSDPEVCRFLLHEAWTKADAVAAVNKRMRRSGLNTQALAMVVEHEGTVVGNVEAWLVDGSPALVELGWTFDPAVSGRGYATEAVNGLIDHVFSLPQIHRVSAQMDGRNEASARLAARVGMRQEAHFRQTGGARANGPTPWCTRCCARIADRYNRSGTSKIVTPVSSRHRCSRSPRSERPVVTFTACGWLSPTAPAPPKRATQRPARSSSWRAQYRRPSNPAARNAAAHRCVNG
ncbi:GNAT family N-acetyltransferase [Rhodococcus sp. BS-15]|uniref:GNAT family N-acetyltransferase n=1 Tax=Rhodococcus sp. BS-15 TaxID=1304954 RepID=UPI001F491738|nr:GNAT family N-acetyltransferase [Rhodococcus sp. BS-15]